MERLSDIVKCLICGCDRSGTAALFELARRHPKVDGRFELGRLLFASASEHRESAYRSLLSRNWDVDEESEEYIYQADTAREFYKRLIERSSIDSGVSFICDAAPGYLPRLREILGGCDLPCLVSVQDPRAVYFSMRSRDESLTLDRFCEHYESCANGFYMALTEMPERLCLVKHEELCLYPEAEGERVFGFIGLEFDLKYLRIDDMGKLRPDDQIELSPKSAFRYREKLDTETQRSILERLVEQKDWFSDDELSREVLEGSK